MSNLLEAAWLARRRSSLDGHLVSTLAHCRIAKPSRAALHASAGQGIFTRVEIRMTDGRFYLLLAVLLLALAGGEIVYAMVGPLSEPTRQLDELTSINRVR